MDLPRITFVVAALAGFALAQDLEEPEAPDLTGIWHSADEDVVVRRTGAVSWLGSPTEGRGEAAGISWHFQHLSGDEYQFWIMLRGKATTQKLVDERIRIGGKRDEMTLTVPSGKGKSEPVTFHRLYTKIPDRIGPLVVTFIARGRDDLDPDQNVDVRLVRALERAVEFGRQADPDLKRINVSATIERNLGHSRKHHRLLRCALTIDGVNGAGWEHWLADVEAKLGALEEGRAPDVDPRKDYAKHLTALVLGLLVEEEIDEVVCPAVLEKRTLPYLEWWVKSHGRDLPSRAPSVVGWKKRWEEMLEATERKLGKVKDALHVAVRLPGKDGCRHKRSKEKRYDRE